MLEVFAEPSDGLRVAIEAIGSKKEIAVVEQDQRVVLMKFVQLQRQAKGMLSVTWRSVVPFMISGGTLFRKPGPTYEQHKDAIIRRRSVKYSSTA